MEVRFNVTGAERKALVTAVSELTGWEAVYMKAPSFAYAVKHYIIDKNGTLVFNEHAGAEDARSLLEALAGRGFACGEISGAESSAADAPGEAGGGRMSIEVPLEGFTETALSNLERMVESKAELIRKSLGADDVSIETAEDRLVFPWFPADASPDEAKAYTQFVHALCEMAKTQKRVTAKAKPVESEKFSFRCFLLRLGFIGSQYAMARKVLLANLSGDGSFKSGKREKNAPETAQNAGSGASGAGPGVAPETADAAANPVAGGGEDACV